MINNNTKTTILKKMMINDKLNSGQNINLARIKENPSWHFKPELGLGFFNINFAVSDLARMNLKKNLPDPNSRPGQVCVSGCRVANAGLYLSIYLIKAIFLISQTSSLSASQIEPVRIHPGVPNWMT